MITTPKSISLPREFIRHLLLLLWTLLPPSVLAQFNYTVVDGTATITQYTGLGGQVDIPTTLGGFPVSHIGGWSFQNRTAVTGVTIPASITRVGTNAFIGCSGLTQIHIPETVTQVDDGAFANCRNLTNISVSSASTNFISINSVLFDHARQTLLQFPAGLGGDYPIPNGVSSVANMAFLGCASLSRVSLPSSVSALGSRAFERCSGLITADLSPNLQTLPDRVFAYCSSLSGISIPVGVTNLGPLAFYSVALTQVTLPEGIVAIGLAGFSDCSALTTVNFPTSLRRIDSSAFAGCSQLASVVFPTGITEIGHSAFRGCASLTNLLLPESVSTLGQGAFALCVSLPSVRIPQSLPILDELVFEGCVSLREAILPAGLTNLHTGALSGCTALTNITLPTSLLTLGDRAFANSGLIAVTIPSSVAAVGYEAFANSTNLTSVYFLGDAPTDPGVVFSPNPTTSVYYLAGTSGWGSSFGGSPIQPWAPQAQESGFVTDHFAATVTGPESVVIIMDASPTVEAPQWQPVATNTLSFTSRTTLLDPRLSELDSQFYRFRSP